MFENLTSKFEEIFSSLKKEPSLNEVQVDEGLTKIRQALLEADVALPVAKELVKNIKPKAIGQEVIRSTTPGQMIVKIVYDEVVKILGDSKSFKEKLLLSFISSILPENFNHAILRFSLSSLKFIYSLLLTIKFSLKLIIESLFCMI